MTLANAKVTYEGWNGTYPAPDGAEIIFTCELGFTDEKRKHHATCSTSDFWCTSFDVHGVTCPEPVAWKLPVALSKVYPDCRKTEKGKEYVGRRNKTATGKNCLRWDSKPYGKPNDFEINMLYEEHFLNEDPGSHENYCRNPTLKEKPWCFVSEPDIQWEYCDIPFCEDRVPLECKLTQKGGEYMGKKNRTISGLSCKPWLKVPRSFQYRKWSSRRPAFSDDVDAEHNYCRNAGGRPGGPWCYNGDPAIPGIEWQYCDVPFCSLPKTELNEKRGNEEIYPNCRKTKMGKEYMGIINTSETGKRCMEWDSFRYIETFPDIMVKHLPLTTDKKKVTCNHRHLMALAVPLECTVTGGGGEYLGRKNVTKSGKPCQPWLSRIPEDSKIDILLSKFPDPIDSTHNFCRSPYFFSMEGPWCWVSTPSGIHVQEDCDIPICYKLLLESLSNTYNYRYHTFGEIFSLDKNYCRNPGFKDRPWCYVIDPNMTWEYCDIPFCDDRAQAECKFTECGADYAGTKNVTQSGIACEGWGDIKRREEKWQPWKKNEGLGLEIDHNFCQGKCIAYTIDPEERDTRWLKMGPSCYSGQELLFCDVPFCPLKLRPKANPPE
ncbi:unnamed protein product [Darwinula stevensoni]|uniref:Kringle domain-containing protein n=1 Tax=Darwinula stevensoni TaxID=69355 RepID=A0A7R9AAP5_9CRUS|nr:unnamed protein product [Darwinula stevensoni]CAG0898652.1 unnamed protein product [Darwinula stevensoni]